MNIVRIPKKKPGEFRTIYVPNDVEAASFRKHLPVLNQKALNVCGSNVHGFMCGKSPVTNAKAHVGFRFSLSFDLKDFFDTVKESHLKGKLSAEQIQECLIDGAPRQGLPTSPVVANIGAIDLDKAIQKYLSSLKEEVVYSRYADDLTFSFRFHWTYEKLKERIPAIIHRCGFKPNGNKTRLQDALFGNRNITGVSVGLMTIHTPRAIKRRIRAAKHQGNASQLKGLQEWAKMKMPVSAEEKKRRAKEQVCDVKEVNTLAAFWRQKGFKPRELAEKKSVRITDAIEISTDPVYLLGPSDWNPSWSSCIAHPKDGSKKTRFFVLHPAIRIAVYKDAATMTIGGITRSKIKARAFVFSLESGEEVYGRLYGDSDESRIVLKKALEWEGYQSSNLHKGKYLRGTILGSVGEPYLDNIAQKLSPQRLKRHVVIECGLGNI